MRFINTCCSCTRSAVIAASPASSSVRIEMVFRADIPREFPRPGVSRDATFHHPAVFAIRSPETILHPERLSGMEGRQEAVEAALQIVWVHAFGPSCAHFLLHASASELEPWS